MASSTHIIVTAILASFLSFTSASCEPNVAFYPPHFTNNVLNDTFENLTAVLTTYFTSDAFTNSSCSIQVTSSEYSLWSTHYTSPSGNQGTPQVNGSSTFRIASNTKVFTALAILQLQATGRIDLDSSVVKYIPSLLKEKGGKINWKKISVRSLLTHMSGVPDNYAEEDILDLGGTTAAAALGLPSATNATIASLPACERDVTLPCDAAGMFSSLQTASPVFPPHVEASYSNVGYNLLGLVVESTSGVPYTEYIRNNILNPLSMKSTSFTTPDQATGSIPLSTSQWGEDLGIGDASGGLYSSSDDMVKLLRYIMTNYNTISPTINWLLPGTYSTGSHSFIGMPWEIFRTTSILGDTNRPVTIVTKGGGLLGFYSYSVLLPEYNLAVSILLSGNVGAVTGLLDMITTPLVQAAELVAQQHLATTYTGTYVSSSADTAFINLTQSSSRSLFISNLTSNGVDVLPALQNLVAGQAGTSANLYWQIVPTFENRCDSKTGQVGEVWRLYDVLIDDSDSGGQMGDWNDYCVSNFDPISYAGLPLNEVIFWKQGNGSEAVVESIELSAWRVKLDKK